MKKIYLSAATIFVFLCVPALMLAQPFTGGLFQTIPAGGPLSAPATWVGPKPPNPCNACQIKVFGNSTVDFGPSRMTNKGQLIIMDAAVLTVNQRVIISGNTTILIGSTPTGAASMVMNAEVDLDTTCTVRLANQNVFIDATSGLISFPGSDSIDKISGDGGGFYYITAPTKYSELLTTNQYGDKFAVPDAAHPTFLYATYMINCGGASPNICATGVVYGPAISGFNPTDSIYRFNVTSVLPVELVLFTATPNSNQTVSVSWSTAQEVNSSYYSIERSANAVDFIEIGRVRAKGFSSITADYSYTDLHPLSGNSYYRLQMVDLDGKYKYSKVIMVSTDKKPASLIVFSNPFTDEVRLQVNATMQDQLVLNLTDLTGRTILHQSFSAQSGNNFINLRPANTISRGIYLLNIRGNTIYSTIKLIKN